MEAQKLGLSVPEYVEKLKQQALEHQQAQMRAHQQAQQEGGGEEGEEGGQGGPQPIQPGPPKPEALAVANFLKSQDLKVRTCILNGQRKDMFKGKSNVFQS